MGQRLNIEIVAGEDLLANSYYHWSGYTSSSLRLGMTVWKCLSQFESSGEARDVLVQRAVSALMLTGAKQSGGTRNDGFINTDAEGMEENRCGEEARITFDVVGKTVMLDNLRHIFICTSLDLI